MVDSAAAGSDKLSSLLDGTDGLPGIDLYLARQRLIGRGPNLLAEEGLLSAELFCQAPEILLIDRVGAGCYRKDQPCLMLPHAQPEVEAERLIFHTAGDQVVLSGDRQ
ncbi:MAG: hypothetical protein R2864_05555 [Syntrophotaleaceae bacterium]